MFFFQNLTAELFLLESPDDSYFPKSGGSTFLKTVGSHFSEICGNKITAYTQGIRRVVFVTLSPIVFYSISIFDVLFITKSLNSVDVITTGQTSKRVA